MARKVIAYKNLPTRIPLTHIMVVMLLLDRLSVPTYIWYAVLGIYCCVLFLIITRIEGEERIDLWKEDK
jgi:hypothetical protein